jgi:hypothetical protein
MDQIAIIKKLHQEAIAKYQPLQDALREFPFCNWNMQLKLNYKSNSQHKKGFTELASVDIGSIRSWQEDRD